MSFNPLNLVSHMLSYDSWQCEHLVLLHAKEKKLKKSFCSWVSMRPEAQGGKWGVMCVLSPITSSIFHLFLDPTETEIIQNWEMGPGLLSSRIFRLSKIQKWLSQKVLVLPISVPPCSLDTDPWFVPEQKNKQTNKKRPEWQEHFQSIHLPIYFFKKTVLLLLYKIIAIDSDYKLSTS